MMLTKSGIMYMVLYHDPSFLLNKKNSDITY